MTPDVNWLDRANCLDGNLALRPGPERADGAATTVVCEEPAEHDQQELWDAPMVSAVS